MTAIRNMSVWCCVLLALLASVAAQAIVKVNLSIKDVYTKADAVLLGTVAQVAPAGTVEVTVQEVVKGTYAPAQCHIAFAQATDVPMDTAVGGPVVIIIGRLSTLVHLGDSWRVATPGADAATVQVGPQETRTLGDLATAFPGRTPMLALLIADLKACKTLDDYGKLIVDDTGRGDGPIEISISHKGFAYIQQVQDLGIQHATSIWTGGLDKEYDLPTLWPNDTITMVIANGESVRVFVPAPRNSATKYTDQTAALGLDKAKARICAGGDLNADGKPDLLLGANVWIQRADGTFNQRASLPSLPADSEWVAATLADANGDGNMDIVVLLKDGTLVTLVNDGGLRGPEAWKKTTRTLWTDGAGPAKAVFFGDWMHTGELSVVVVRKGDVVRYACGPTAAKPDNLERLCGTPISRYTGFTPVNTTAASGRGGIPLPPGTAIRPLSDDEVLGCTAVDFNGRRKLVDFLLVTRTPDGFIGGLPLGYRRYGAFMYNRGVVQSLDRRVKEAKTDLPYGTLLATGGTSSGRGQNIVFLKPNGELWQVVNAGG